MLSGGLGRLVRLPLALLGPQRRFGIGKTVRGGCCPAGRAKAVLHPTECIVWDEFLHPSYYRYSWDEDRLLDYCAHKNCHAQLAPLCSGYDTLPLAAAEFVALSVARRNFQTSTSPPVETLLNSNKEDLP